MSQILLSSCTVCLSRKSSDNTRDLIATVPCGHVLHKSCLLTWWKSETRSDGLKSCPSCRSLINLNNIGYVNLFGLNPLTTTETTTTTTTTTEDAPPSSDGCTQDTQEIVERFRKNERLSRKGKAKMIIHDDEEEDNHSEEKKKELIEAISEKKVYEKHSLDLEKQLKFLEEQFEVTRQENEDLQDELTRCNADVLLDLEELNEKLENDNKSLNEKLDRKRYKLYELKSKNQKLEAELLKEGDSGRLRIKELENEIDSYERRLLHEKARTDKVKLDLEEAQKRAEKEIKSIQGRTNATKEILKEQARTRIESETQQRLQAQEDLKVEKVTVERLKIANKNYEHKVAKLKKKINFLQKKKGKPILDSDSDEENQDSEDYNNNRYSNPQSPTSLKHSRQPLASTSSHNQGFLSRVSSSPPPPRNFKIKNHSSLISPNKMHTFENYKPEQIAGGDKEQAGEEEEEQEEDDIYAPPEQTRNDEVDSDLEIIDPTPINLTKQRSNNTSWKQNQLEFSNPPPLAQTVSSKYFSSSNSQQQLQKNPFPSLKTTTASRTTSSITLGKRPFERSKSDKYLPDFAREGVVVQTGPKRKVKRM